MTDDELPEAADDGLDLVASLRKADPLSVFLLSIGRVSSLLDTGGSGIDASKKMIGTIKQKIVKARKKAKGEEVIIRLSGSGKEAREISVTDREMGYMQEAMNLQEETIKDLDYYLHNILCVYAWSAFEGYNQALLYDIFISNPDLIVSERKISTIDIIRARDNIIPYVVSAEIDDVGRRSFRELQQYMSARFQICYAGRFADRLGDFYFLRNVISHTGGRVRTDQADLVPDGIQTEGDQLRIEKAYVIELIQTLREAVVWFDAQIHARVSQPA